MWKARRQGWFAHRYVVEERSACVGTLALGAWGSPGTIEIEGRQLALSRKGFWKLEVRVLELGRLVATARSAGAFQRGFYLVHGEEEYSLDPSSWWGGSFDLTQRGRLLGRIRAVGISRRHVHIDIDERLAPELRLFALWLAAFTWQRAAGAAAG